MVAFSIPLFWFKSVTWTYHGLKFATSVRRQPQRHFWRVTSNCLPSNLLAAVAACPRLSLFSLMRKVTKRIMKKRNSLTLKQSLLPFLGHPATALCCIANAGHCHWRSHCLRSSEVGLRTRPTSDDLHVSCLARGDAAMPASSWRTGWNTGMFVLFSLVWRCRDKACLVSNGSDVKTGSYRKYPETTRKETHQRCPYINLTILLPTRLPLLVLSPTIKTAVQLPLNAFLNSPSGRGRVRFTSMQWMGRSFTRRTVEDTKLHYLR